jgi:hypothetical protein
VLSIFTVCFNNSNQNTQIAPELTEGLLSLSRRTGAITHNWGIVSLISITSGTLCERDFDYPTSTTDDRAKISDFFDRFADAITPVQLHTK